MFNETCSTVLLLYKKKSILYVNSTVKGFKYLHKACNPSLIYRAVKANNILLNANLMAKIGNFGISRVLNNDARYFGFLFKNLLFIL